MASVWSHHEEWAGDQEPGTEERKGLGKISSMLPGLSSDGSTHHPNARMSHASSICPFLQFLQRLISNDRVDRERGRELGKWGALLFKMGGH